MAAFRNMDKQRAHSVGPASGYPVHPPSPIASVIVPTYNSRGAVLRCLEALLHQTVPSQVMEILVVDDGSTDGTEHAIRHRFPTVRLFVTPNRGAREARLFAIAHARGETVLFTDEDCVPQRDWVQRAMEELAGGADILTGRVRHGDRFLDRLTAIADFGDFQLSQPCPTTNFPFCNVAMPRQTAQDHLARVPLRSGSDRVLSWRLHKLGYRIRYNPRMEVRHCPVLDFRALTRRRYRNSHISIVARELEPSLPGGKYMRYRWAVPFGFAVARLARDLAKLARARRCLDLNPFDVLAVSVGLGLLRFYDCLQMVRVALTVPSPLTHPGYSGLMAPGKKPL